MVCIIIITHHCPSKMIEKISLMIKKGLKELVMQWADTDRIVFVDSYFASVPAAE